MKKCIYCSEFIDIKNDDFKKIGSKHVCALCYDDYANEIDACIYESEDCDENSLEEGE